MQYILPFQFNASPLRLLRHNPPADAESVNKKHSAGTVWSSLHSINGLAPFSHNLVCPLNLLFHIIHHGKKIRVTDLELNVHMVTHDNFLFTNQKFRMINIMRRKPCPSTESRIKDSILGRFFVLSPGSYSIYFVS